MTPKELYARYASAVAYVAVITPDGSEATGTAFHIGEGVFVTARHVVENNQIVQIGTTTYYDISDPNGLVTKLGQTGKFRTVFPGKGVFRSGPYFHPDPTVDVAAIVVDGLEPPVVPLGSHLDNWIDDDAFILTQVVIMGYPPIPFSRAPLLVAARAEINAVIDKYTGGHPHFVVSATPRGGFSGGLCITEWDFALGVITESLSYNNQPLELGFMGVLSIEPIFVCLLHHNLLPTEQKTEWKGFWDNYPGL